MTISLTEYTDGMYVRMGENHWDAAILRQVALRDEYRVRGLLKPDDIVLDIGAHIGSFSYLALKQGVRPGNIYAFEAFPDNYMIAEKNLAWRGIHVNNVAVWSKSDLTRHYDGPVDNTGGGNVFWTHTTDVTMSTISLDDILESIEYNGQSAHNNSPQYHEAYVFPGVRMLKIDCETSEFPILLSCRRIRDIQTIVGEYHETAHIPDDAQPEGSDIKYEAYTSDVLKQWLEGHGFHVEILDRAFFPGGNAIGHFRAERI